MLGSPGSVVAICSGTHKKYYATIGHVQLSSTHFRRIVGTTSIAIGGTL